MTNQVFVPVNDELIYNHPEQIEGPLVPYSAGMECSEWLSIEINPEETESEIAVVQGKVMRKTVAKVSAKSKSKLRLAYSS